MNKNINADNKRIAKNTLLLYIRMFITMAVGLFTSRVVLNVLGVSDYGIYNVVGGIITMASFLNSAMVASTQRFISFELGKRDMIRLRNVFCTSVNIHVAIAFISVILGETLGLWFVNTQLNLPEERMYAVNWVYQCSILTFIFTVISVPYNACIVAHEKMNVYAYISIFEVLMKLVIVYALLISSIDKLVLYSILLAFVAITVRFLYSIYCHRKFEECKYQFIFDKELSIQMFSFAGWSVIGNMGFTLKDQISNIILNLFFGPSVNAARGIGLHVSSLINTFSTNFAMAINPQITKQYAVGNLYESQKLVYVGARFTFLLLSVISIPIIVNIDYLLKLWLGIVPEYTSSFMILSILACLLYSLSGSVTTAIQATGNIKWFQIGVSVIVFSELPIAYILLKLGCKPYAVMYPTILTYTIAVFFRFFLLHRMIPSYNIRTYLFDVVLRCILLFLISWGISQFIANCFTYNLFNLLITTSISFIVTAILVMFLGLKNKERSMLIKKIINIKFKQNIHD